MYTARVNNSYQSDQTPFYQWRKQRGQCPERPILQTNHKHTFQLHYIWSVDSQEKH